MAILYTPSDTLPSVSQFLPFLLAAIAIYSLVKLARFILVPLWSPLRKLPHPANTSVLWGNMAEIFKAPSGELHAEWEKQFGHTFAYRQMLSRWRLCTLDPRAVSHIVNHAYVYPKPGQVQRNLARILGEGLLVAEGDVHKRQRRIMNPSFSPAQIRDLTPIFWDKAVELRDVWQARLTEAGDGGDVVIDIVKWMSRATLDIIGLAGFGYAFETLKDESNELAAAFSDLFNIQRPGIFVILLNIFPALRHLPIRRNRIQQRSMSTMRRIGMELVGRRKEAVMRSMDGKREEKDIGRSMVAGRDLLTALVRANMATDVSPAHQLSDEEVLAQISTFLLAGHETTSTAVTWALFALCTHPHVQSKLRAELLAFPEDRPGMDDLNAIPYLDAVVREVMRFHAPVGGTLRVAVQDDEVPVDKPYRDVDGVERTSITVRKGDGVYIPIKNINRSEALWGPDGNVFNPDRWANMTEESAHIPGVWAHMMSFLGGPRACIGYRFSIIEIKVFLFTLVRAFEYEFADPTMEFEERSTIVSRPVIKGQAKKGATMPLRLRAVSGGAS